MKPVPKLRLDVDQETIISITIEEWEKEYKYIKEELRWD